MFRDAHLLRSSLVSKWWWDESMVHMTTEQPVNEILAIRRYHMIYTIPYRHLSHVVHPSLESKQSAWKTGVPLKYLNHLLNGLRIEVEPQWMKFSYYFTFFMTVLVKFQIEIRFSLNCIGIQNCQWHYVHHPLGESGELTDFQVPSSTYEVHCLFQNSKKYCKRKSLSKLVL